MKKCCHRNHPLRKDKTTKMTVASIKKRFREDGVCFAFCYYFFRLLSKTEKRLVGLWVRKHGKICENRILLKNRQMQDFTDNPKALFEYLIENGYNEKYQIIWAVSEKKKFANRYEKNVIFVTAENKYGFTSARAYYYGNTAEYFCYTNHTAELNEYHCSGQTVINLWHGCGYKGVVHDKKQIPEDKMLAAFDYALVPGPVFVETKSRYWKCGKEKILPLGYPRYDWMLKASGQRRQILEGLFGWQDRGEKVVLWMPTFRQSMLEGYAENNINLPFELPALKNQEEFLELNQYCAQKRIRIIVKKHPLQTGWKMRGNFENIRYISDEMLEQRDIPLYTLIGICDGLLSDYSSVAVDYLLLNRPIGYILADYEEYAKTRGFIFENPLDYMPGEKIYGFADLKKFLGDIDDGKDEWKEARKKILTKFHNRADCYCERIVRELFEKENGKGDGRWEKS